MMFVAVVLVLEVFTYGLGRALQWLFAAQIGPKQRRWLMVAAFAVTNLLIVGLLLQLGSGLFRIVAGWLVLLLYVMYAALATFILYLLLCRVMPQRPLARSLRVFAPLFFIGLVGWSVYHAYVPKVVHLNITIDKPLAQPLTLGLASDLHLGRLVGARQLDKLANIFAEEKVDLIVLPGDLMDDDTAIYVAENMKPHLQKLSAPLGVFATLGNHDLFGHANEIKQELQAAGITVLDNETRRLNQGIWLVGRRDDLDQQRPTTASLIKNIPDDAPIILLDHRPTEIDRHATLPIDLQVSGHVHNGQIAPANLLVRTLYSLANGYQAIGKGHYVVTSGYGFWGVPFRLGSQAEVWIIHIEGRS